MRFAGGWAGLLMLLAGCGPIGVEASGVAPGSGASQSLSGPSETPVGDDFDYRYAFRLPAGRILQVQEAHLRGCDQLGRTRCRVVTNRYHVNDQDNSVSAVLAFQIDPAVARPFGLNAGATVKTAGGLVMDSRMVDGEARAGNVVSRLRDEIASIDTQLKGTLPDPQRQAALDKQNRLRSAIAAIGEIDRNATQGVATTPMLFTYQSGNVIPALGGSTSATFGNAGDVFVQSAAAMAQVLAGVGPWLLLLFGGALILRRFIQPEAPEPVHEVGVPLPQDEPNRNVVQRWFSREPERDPENVA